ncbi:MAG TPA: BlaI/MecI/CopY family transcriptional regulator [Microbacteriaceae bacterium]|nr:BlaI/MecI/CopY family transcriptional regulator [Microbacteriaceae bacterium]
MSSREVCDLLAERGMPLSLTTVITGLQRLTRKGVLLRHPGRSRRTWLFRPAQSPAERIADLMGDALAGAIDREAALLQFAGNLDDEDLDVLRSALEDQK